MASAFNFSKRGRLQEITGHKKKDNSPIPRVIAWQITLSCNSACLHCYTQAGRKRDDELTDKEVFNLAKKIVALKVPYPVFTGGDPLLHPLFFKLAEFFRKNNISLKVETNGTLLNEENIAKLIKIGFRAVEMSLDGARAETEEKLRPGSDWGKTVSALKKLSEKGIKTEVLFIPTKLNIREIGKVVELAFSLGVSGFYVGKLMKAGRAVDNFRKLEPSRAEYAKLFKTLEDKKKKYKNKMKIIYYDVVKELKNELNNPISSFFITSNGKVKIKGSLPFICGDLRKQNIRQIWHKCKKEWESEKVVNFIKQTIKSGCYPGVADNR